MFYNVKTKFKMLSSVNVNTVPIYCYCVTADITHLRVVYKCSFVELCTICVIPSAECFWTANWYSVQMIIECKQLWCFTAFHIIQLYFTITSDRVLHGRVLLWNVVCTKVSEVYLYLFTDCFMENSLQSSVFVMSDKVADKITSEIFCVCNISRLTLEFTSMQVT